MALSNYKMTNTSHVWSILLQKQTELTLENSLAILSVSIFHAVSQVYSGHGHYAYVVAKINPWINPRTCFDNFMVVQPHMSFPYSLIWFKIFLHCFFHVHHHVEIYFANTVLIVKCSATLEPQKETYNSSHQYKA